MYKRLLLPLDGTRMAESILPVAKCLTEVLNATVVLIHVIEKNAPQEVHGDQHLHDVNTAEQYLQKISEQWFAGKIKVETHVHTEEVTDVTHSILQHVQEFKSDLTLMCTHGHTGTKQFLYGSIAQQIAASAVPVLFIRATDETTRPDFTLGKIIVPLDGDPDHEQGLNTATEIAKICHSSIHLITVIPDLNRVSGSWTQSVRLLPSTTERMLGMEVEVAQEYHTEQLNQLSSDGITRTSDVLRGEPADEIIHATTLYEADLIVLGTHGTVGTEAFWTGSVAAKVARKTAVPVLLVPAAKK